METVLWSITILALLMAFAAWRRAAALREQVDELRRTALISGGDTEQTSKGLEVLRKQVAWMADGRSVTREMVSEQRLHQNASAADLQAELEGGAAVHVIDVRTDGEWVGGHIEGALHIPVDDLEKRLHEVPRDGKPLYLVCAAGGRSAAAAEFLSGRGWVTILNVEGGMGAWRGTMQREETQASRPAG